MMQKNENCFVNKLKNGIAMINILNAVSKVSRSLGLIVVTFGLAQWLMFDKVVGVLSDEIDLVYDVRAIVDKNDSVAVEGYVNALRLYGGVLAKIGDGRTALERLKCFLLIGCLLNLMGCISVSEMRKQKSEL